MDWSTIVATVVGALAALVGGALTPVITSRRAHRDWRRNKLADASERLSAAILSVMFKFHQPGYKPPKEIEDQDFKQLTSAVGTIAMYGSEDLAAAAFEVMDAYEALRTHNSGQSIGELIETIAKRGGKVTALMRRDLNLVRLPAGPVEKPPQPSLSQQALDNQTAKEDRSRRRFKRFRWATRIVFGLYSLFYFSWLARRRRRLRRSGRH